MIWLIKKTINSLLKDYFPLEKQFKFSIEISANEKFGDLSTNVLMVYGKKIINFEEFKEKIFQHLNNLPYIDKVEYVHPGFLNFFLKPSILKDIDLYYEELDIGNGKNISIEYASPNPTGPCHIGHARGSVIGDILVSVFSYLGYNVRKDCIFNDGGNQVNSFIESIYLRYLQLKGKIINEENIVYEGEYINDIAKQYLSIDINSFEEFESTCKIEILEIMKKDMIEVLDLLHIQHHVITYESKLKKEKDTCWNILKNKDLLSYEKTPKGEKILFKSSDFADDKDRVIEREDGTVTYFGNDIAYHFSKRNLIDKDNNQEFSHQIIILGDDHIGYLKRLSSAVVHLDINLQIVTHNLVKIFKENEEIKMSKRKGNFITIRDFLKDYSQDILRVLLIEYGYTSVINLNLDNLSSNDNPLFYIEYIIQRISNLIKKNSYNIDLVNFNLLNSTEDKKIITYLIYWPEFIKNISINLEVNLIFNYLRNFSKFLHTYLSIHKILTEDKVTENTRLYLMEKSLHLIDIICKLLKILNKQNI
jgi:arginyl-tRNA synthetase